jgi:hypothetical protein
MEIINLDLKRILLSLTINYEHLEGGTQPCSAQKDNDKQNLILALFSQLLSLLSLSLSLPLSKYFLIKVWLNLPCTFRTIAPVLLP